MGTISRFSASGMRGRSSQGSRRGCPVDVRRREFSGARKNRLPTKPAAALPSVLLNALELAPLGRTQMTVEDPTTSLRLGDLHRRCRGRAGSSHRCRPCPRHPTCRWRHTRARTGRSAATSHAIATSHAARARRGAVPPAPPLALPAIPPEPVVPAEYPPCPPYCLPCPRYCPIAPQSGFAPEKSTENQLTDRQSAIDSC